MSQSNLDFLKDPIWQGIAVVVGLIIGILGLFVAIFALSDPLREVCASFCIIVLAATFILSEPVYKGDKQSER